MGKNKIKRFAENETFRNMIQPATEEALNKNYPLKGNWNTRFFTKPNPIVLELGCGKGEYTVELARKFPSVNFLGVDIKGARMWRGAKTAIEENLTNAGFLRTRIELISSFFEKGEVSEIWCTFPDPQLKSRRAKKRLTSAGFLSNYQKFLKDNGFVHLKTDSIELYTYTLELVKFNNLQIEISTTNLYQDLKGDDILSIRTHYEQGYLDQGKTINYLKFRLPSGLKLKELPKEEEDKQ